MVLLRIQSKDETKIDKIAALLLEEGLGMDLSITRNIDRLGYEKKKVSHTRVHLLTAKTKGLLFPLIDEKVRALFPESLPEIYTTPIVHMDWEQSKQLAEVVQVV